MSKVRDMLEKFPQLEELLQKILSDMKNMNLQQIREQIALIFKQIQSCISKEEFNKFMSDDYSELKSKVASMESDINTIKDILANSSNNGKG